MSEKLEELERLLSEKVEREEEWSIIEIEDIKPINISRIRKAVKNLPKPAIILAILVKYFEKFNKKPMKITKLTKIAFEVEKKIFEPILSTSVLSFKASNYGPFTEAIYDYLGFLQNLDLVELVEKGNKTEIVLTQKGLEVFNEKIRKEFPDKLLEMIERVVGEYGAMSHDELLRRVYKEYPEYAERSLVKDKYL